MMRLMILAGGVLSFAPPAQAAAQSQTVQEEQTEAVNAEGEPVEEKKVCRTERTTGSLTRRTRVCLTEAQWREVHDRTRRGVGEMQGSAAGGKQCVMDQGGGCR